jgi:hypothetical protein
MNQTETEKFNNVLKKGYGELVEKRSEKSYEHFIYFLLNNVSQEQREIHPEL